jgi:parallel beta-helix repeat protein
LFLLPTVQAANISEISSQNTGSVLYVGGSGPGNYSTIQEALNAAIHGDTIYVYSGIYPEILEIRKQITLIGEHKDTTIIDGHGQPVIVDIFADYVKIKYFTITNSSGSVLNNAATVLAGDHIQFTHNKMTNHPYNALKVEGEYIEIIYNQFSESANVPYAHGTIYLGYTKYITFSHNTITQNGIGLVVANSDFITIKTNNFIKNQRNLLVSGTKLKNLYQLDIDNNHWNRPCVFPKPIFGYFRLTIIDPISIPIPLLLCFDRNPEDNPHEF